MTNEADTPADQLREVPTWLVVLTMGGAFLCFLADFSLGFAQDPCGNNNPDNPVWICRPQVLTIDLIVPWIGWIASIVVAVLGWKGTKHRNRPTLISAIGAVVVYAGTLVVAFGIALVNYPG